MTLEQGVPAVLVGTPAGAFPEVVVVLFLSGCVFIWFDPIGMSAGKREPSPWTDELLGATRSEVESGCIIISIRFGKLKLNFHWIQHRAYIQHTCATRQLCIIIDTIRIRWCLAIGRVSPLVLAQKESVQPWNHQLHLLCSFLRLRSKDALGETIISFPARKISYRQRIPPGIELIRAPLF